MNEQVHILENTWIMANDTAKMGAPMQTLSLHPHDIILLLIGRSNP